MMQNKNIFRIDTARLYEHVIGQRIVKHEQQGEQRAAYGKRVLVSLAEALSAEFGKGFSRHNLTIMRHFYDERTFYEIEAAQQWWDVRTLSR